MANAETFDNYSESSTTDQRHTVAVQSVAEIAPNVLLLRTTRNAYAFVPGQNVSIGPHLAYHKSKDFTICSGREDDFLEFMIKENDRGSISPLLRQLQPGTKLDITGPYGEFFYRAQAPGRHVFLATGIGISPIRSFLKSYPISNYLLIHGLRTAADTTLTEGLDPSRLVTCMTQENGGTFQGRITDYLQTAELLSDDLYYVVGNPLAVKDIIDHLQERGVDPEHIIQEFYYAY
ncbi:MAG: FAD-dependent oxidoreductase [Kiritimatiellae bacterium]|nr:FAD-dependent oxidoreductase [Kiritimatiellia bacterium]MDD4342495.1 FAD-dependent oxidoreductase [Kiritimatiellia bacterium]MDY0150596.1 FAD-dependent oxidoreductase [Kiritimatiellia bacterium]